MGTPILFSSENVRSVLVNLPSVAALLPDPALEASLPTRSPASSET
jgi:hypothetical protein